MWIRLNRRSGFNIERCLLRRDAVPTVRNNSLDRYRLALLNDRPAIYDRAEIKMVRRLHDSVNKPASPIRGISIITWVNWLVSSSKAGMMATFSRHLGTI